jgi:hypothetical protein
MLQRYRDGGLSDAIAFRLRRLSWNLGGESGRTRTETDLRRGERRGAPRGGCRRSDSRARTDSR